MSSAASLAAKWSRSFSMSVPLLDAVGVVRDTKCTGAGTGAFSPLAGGLSAHSNLLPTYQGVMASPGACHPGLFLRGGDTLDAQVDVRTVQGDGQ